MHTRHQIRDAVHGTEHCAVACSLITDTTTRSRFVFYATNIFLIVAVTMMTMAAKQMYII